jgi:hypothetical protein
LIFTAATGPHAGGANSRIGAVMNDHYQSDNSRPYSPVLCVLLLLTTGIAVKIGAAIHACQLAQSACFLPLNW